MLSVFEFCTKAIRQCTRRGVSLLLMLLFAACSLAPSDIDPPPIFELNGVVEFEASEVDVDEGTAQILLALSWYVFTTNSLDPAPFALATQTVTSADEAYQFSLALAEVPPPSAFVLTGANRFLELPAEGNLAIGFITARPWVPEMNGTFAWTTPDILYQTCPFESQLVLWWDGPELDHEEIGFESGTLRKGLNLIDVADGGNGPEGYRIFPASSPIVVDVCSDGYRAPLRSCGLPQDRSVETIYVSGSENEDENPEPPLGGYECDQCGASYRVPDVCTRRLNILCRDCRSQVVETDPNDLAPNWLCENPPEFCDPGDEPLCLLGRRFSCENNQWNLTETCDDQCCEAGCIAE